LLRWETKTEIQNSGFDIERRTEKEGSFVKIGFIKGSGNSNTPEGIHFLITQVIAEKYFTGCAR